MSLGNKYTKPCGCAINKTASYNGSCGCYSSPESAPSPCCEAHDTYIKTSNCFRVTCRVTVPATKFYLAFSNIGLNDVPLNSNDVYFYHESTGLIKIHTFSGTSYEVSLVNPAKAGAVISPEDCVMIAVQTGSTGTTGSNNSRCITGLFTSPAVNGEETIYIWNGAGIPIGSTITINNGGTLGSYTVTSLVSVVGDVAAYKVQNIGAGLAGGTTVNGGDSGECLVPVSILTTVDFCNTSESQTLDNIAGCLNGVARALKPTAENQVPVSNASNDWTLKILKDFKLCLTLKECLKLNGDFCTSGDVVEVEQANTDEFTVIYNAATAGGGKVVVKVGDVYLQVDAWNNTANVLTLSGANSNYLGTATTLTFDAGTQLCVELEDACCKDIQSVDFRAAQAGQAGNVNIPFFPGNSYYLIGFNQAGVFGTQVIDATFNDSPSASGALIPRHTDRLMLREKICNTSVFGRSQDLEVYINYELGFINLPALVRVNYSIGSFIATSDTGPTGQTPGSASNASKAFSAGAVDGPSVLSTLELPGTNVGFGGPAQPKTFPHVANDFRDSGILHKCECANIISWFFVFVQTLPGYAGGNGSFDLAVNFRRILNKTPRHLIGQTGHVYNLEKFL